MCKYLKICCLLLLLIISGLFKHIKMHFKTNKYAMIHLVSGACISTHNLLDMILHL